LVDDFIGQKPGDKNGEPVDVNIKRPEKMDEFRRIT
jgi:hypothetical protein